MPFVFRITLFAFRLPSLGGFPIAHIEIVAAGNELLNGDVQDTNTHWICQRITGLGGTVDRAVIVRDRVEVIAREIRAALRRQAVLIFTLGGLGPTADDLTLVAVARAVRVPIEMNDEALQQVAASYVAFAARGLVEDAGLNPSREKMAMLPRGATPLANPVGTAPGVALRAENTTIVSLPGVPAEMKGIFEASLPPLLREILGEGAYAQRVALVRCNDESILAPLLKAVAARHPAVYVKSRARGFGVDTRFRVTLSARGSTIDDVTGHLDAAQEDLRGVLVPTGIAIESIEG